jgi:predicted  nucleic acid-binding Zn-ribbon protein
MELNNKTERLYSLYIQKNNLKKELSGANKRMTKLERELEDLKKKHPN